MMLAPSSKSARLATNLRLRREVQDRLVADHSPEQIARRLREEFPDDPEMWVSHETIYQSLYVQARGGLKRELTRHLRTGRALRKPHRQPDERRERFAGMVMISERPPEVEDRRCPALGGRPDPGLDRVGVRGRHPGRTPPVLLSAPARRAHRRHRPGGDGRQDGRPSPNSCGCH